MKKETLSPDGIKKDLMKSLNRQSYNKEDRRMSGIIYVAMLAITVGVLLKNVFIGLAIFALSGYNIYRYIIELKEYKAIRRVLLDALDRGDISISIEVLSHISEETVYEPHAAWGRAHMTKSITVFYFESGASWRMVRTDRHYDWSPEFYLSNRGLKDTSVRGNEFFYVSLQGHYDISYIYPCKMFELDDSLKK